MTVVVVGALLILFIALLTVKHFNFLKSEKAETEKKFFEIKEQLEKTIHQKKSSEVRLGKIGEN